ncbi:hypothetical protein LTR86_003541 [Recurvomyces mirabilis]|nr:hypothetical protein LTR86_003541 [Recurvomyces mirabilis]
MDATTSAKAQDGIAPWLAVTLALLALLLSSVYYALQKPPHGSKAPPLTKDASAVLGALAFFTQRWDFQQKASRHSPTGNFSFYAGKWPVVSIRGEEARKAFLESKDLAFSEGYSALLAGSPEVKPDNNVLASDVTHGNESGFSAYFNKRLIAMLKGNRLRDGLPQLLQDARLVLDEMAATGKNLTDPFDSIYRMVYKFTMRTVACNEIADDPVLLAKTLKCFEEVEGATTPLSIMYPWLPQWATVRRTIAGGRLYVIFKCVVDARKKNGTRQEDALQHLIDSGDSITDILKFVLGALFAGQLNSGINAAWILVYMTSKPYWLDQIRQEATRVADRYCNDTSLPLRERLMRVPIEAWENEFPIVDMCLKESMRLQSSGSFFRKNVSDHAVPINKEGTEVIPPGVFATYALGDIHYNPQVYTNPDEYDPTRFSPERAEDKKQPYAFVGWGAGRHPCLGMRFAKLENNIIVAFFLAYFSDIKLANADGSETTRIPETNRNNHTAHKPNEHVWLKYKIAAN